MRSLCTILMIFDVHLQCWILLGALRKFSTLRLVLYLESSSNRKELLKALLESSVIKTLILAITWKRNLALIDLKHIFTWRPRTAWNNSIFKKRTLYVWKLLTYIWSHAMCAIFIIPVHGADPVQLLYTQNLKTAKIRLLILVNEETWRKENHIMEYTIINI